jgi:hypothetical protein
MDWAIWVLLNFVAPFYHGKLLHAIKVAERREIYASHPPAAGADTGGGLPLIVGSSDDADTLPPLVDEPMEPRDVGETSLKLGQLWDEVLSEIGNIGDSRGVDAGAVACSCAHVVSPCALHEPI